jgi:thiamine-monophosphate kinase
VKKGERELIEGIRKRAARQDGVGRLVRLGIGDDCAILRSRRGEELVVTTDLSLENVHFRRDWHPAASVGHRCLVRGLSDLAAMGARPEAAFLSIAVPRELAGRWLEGFLDGWMAAAKRYSVVLAGGDTAEAPRCPGSSRHSLFAADILLVGSAPAGKALRRSGASANDILYVTGELGGAAAGLRALSARGREYGRREHLYPEPRLKAGVRLVAKHLATAAIDLSDGLSTDLTHLCEASGVNAIVNRAALPIARGATLDDALNGGEDYELLFTARPGTKVPARLAGVPVRAIGRMIPRRRARHGAQIELRGEDGRRAPLLPGGWEHFRPRGEGKS